MNISIVNVNYLNPQHAKDLIDLLSNYANDPMGGGTELTEYVISNLPTELSKLPHAFSIILYVENKAAGLVNCFEAFSTFYCKPIINIHDIVVVKEFRGRGLSHLMLKKIEDIAKKKNCCKLTLEVLEGNDVAKSAYQKFGFSDYELDPKMGHAVFWQKTLE